ncbi:helix-turn-helix domain-containing protein, partial [Mycobacteroides abscessus]|uniref:helix-turn-helix domain-containing protein n=1 Tax=Mycobacteroides abscessus TaxID=36809 RepID=UPI000D6A743C
MTTLMMVDGDRGETRSEAAVRRLREELAGKRISIAEVARRLGTTQQKLSRRMTGQTPWDVNELDEVCEASGVSFVYVATGIKALPGGPGGSSPRPGLPLPDGATQGNRTPDLFIT